MGVNYKQPKYHNRKTTYHGMQFDSRRECGRFMELQTLESSGEITDLRTQVPFELIPAQYAEFEEQTPSGKSKTVTRCVEKSCTYVADFVYTDRSGKTVVEDAKGLATAEYKIKRKLMLYRYGIRITEV